MKDDESVESLAAVIHALLPDEVAYVGELPDPILIHWSGIVSTRMVVTGERRDHLYASHPETEMLLTSVIRTMLDPDEIHRNNEDPAMAICWRSLDPERTYLMRAAVLVQPAGRGDASILSARKTRRKDYERENRRGKKVWERGA